MATRQTEPIGVIGVGWVGLVTAACFAELGHRVIARDIDAEKVEALQRGETTIHEPGLDELVARNAERIEFTTDLDRVLDAARLLFVCVDTPPTESGDADLSRVQAVVEELGAGDGHVLVMKSTVPAGTGAAIKRDHPGISYVSCPEFLKEGSAVEDFMHPDRVVVGADPGDEEAGAAVAALYAPLGGELVRDRRDQRRDDQARLERLPRREDLLHQRDRQRLRGGRAPTCATSPAGSASTIGSARSSCRPGSAGAVAASARTSPRSSSWRRTPATTSSCSTR